MGLPVLVGKNLAKSAIDSIAGSLGINTKKADSKTYERRQAAEVRNVKMAQEGDPIALAMLGAIGGVKPLPFAVTDTKYTWRGTTLPKGWSSTVAGWGRPGYTRIMDRAAQWYNSLKSGESWPGSSTSAPGATTGSSPGTAEPSGPSAPAAPKRSNSPATKPLCKYGMRDPVTGRCPPKPTASSGSGARGFKSASKPPCKYGPRGADGYCPKKPRAVLTKADNKKLNQLTTKAARAAEKVVTAGARGAYNAVKSGLAASGVTAGTAVAVTAAVAAAAAVGWFIGQEINRNWSGVAKQERLVQAGLDRIHALTALAKQLGVYNENVPGMGLTAAQIKPFTDAYKRRVDQINSGGFS